MMNTAKSQGIERESLSGETVADQLRLSGVNDAYNLRLGPVTLRVENDFTASYEDNINYAQTGRINDVVLTPSGIVHGLWKVSDLNSINLDVGLGYEFYLLHSQYDSILVSPDSILQFNFFVGDVAFNVHDSFSYEQDPTEIGQLSNTVRLSRFQNDAGIQGTWDLDELIVSLAYDHANLWVTQSDYSYLTNQTDTVAPKLTFKVDKSIQTGLELSLSSVRYDENFQNNSDSLSVGPFVNAQLSENLSVEGQAGGYLADYAQGGGNGDSQDISSYYFNLGVTHRLNQTIKESLVGGKEFIPGLTSNFTQRIFANYNVNWLANPNLSVSGNAFWENLSDSGAIDREESNRYGTGVTCQYTLTDHATVSLNYQYVLKDANPSILSYYQNSVTAGMRYQY
jgi:hypothetical protein